MQLHQRGLDRYVKTSSGSLPTLNLTSRVVNSVLLYCQRRLLGCRSNLTLAVVELRRFRR